ncbi:ATP-dependent DNA helicase [Caerostris extrusa]|uniref:ATP-dependent DNA helicase n=1 Tax=Caerostris extrusa TaxID=172846 RepID=A0AAV4TTP8_CAEEX|nr:ATP-dependent DNA helicase [Caerostris extrusa]
MSEDILHLLLATNKNPEMHFTPNVYNEAFFFIEGMCLAIANKELVQLNDYTKSISNGLFDSNLKLETHFDVEELDTFVQTNLPKLVQEQRLQEFTCLSTQSAWQNYVCV